jgi:DNA-3-methyladenine glycosylase I
LIRLSVERTAKIPEPPQPEPHLEKRSRVKVYGTMKPRCPWAGDDPLYVEYHDNEWGVPSHDDRHLFAMLNLEGAQAGLSWITILRKRDHYRRAFVNWDPANIARFGEKEIARLLADAGIVRNRMKLQATIGNAKAFLKVLEEFGSFDRYLWQFVGGAPIQNRRRAMRDVPPRSRKSDAMSHDLKQRGFRFVGSTICYAFMQAVGMVNDHLLTCFRHAVLSGRSTD